MENKIDLAEINGIVADIMLDYDEAVTDNDPLDERSWGYETGQIFTHNKAKQIAQALEALPKLVAVLDQIEGAPQPFNALEYGSFVETARQLASEALAPFQPKMQLRPIIEDTKKLLAAARCEEQTTTNVPNLH